MNLFTPLLRFRGRTRAAIILGFDGLIAAAGLWLALLLRFEGQVPPEATASYPYYALALMASRVVVNLFFRLHRWSFRFSGLTDGARVAAAGLFGTGLFTLAIFLIHPELPPLELDRLPRSVLVLELLLTTAVMAVVRFSPRLALMHYTESRRARRPGAVRTVILGAGAAGELLLRDLQRSAEHDYHILGFVDDDIGKHRHIVGGKPILGAVSDLPQLPGKYGVSKVLIASPGLSASRLREILDLCSQLKLQFKVLPLTYSYLHDQPASSMLQDLGPEHLLDREEVELADDCVTQGVRERCLLVSGAAGSIGSEVCAQLLAAGGRSLVMVDIDENGLYMLSRRFEREFPDARVCVEVGDIRDAGRMEAIFSHHRPRDIFHAAARKHVPLMEIAPAEAVKTNVGGTLYLADIAERHEVERFVFMSTDKAVRPTNVMGATKRLAELLLQQIGGAAKTRFCVVRFGNVLGSAGSVVPLFRTQIDAGGPVTVTHQDVRRYFMTISEAVGLVLRAAYGDYGRLCVLEMGEPIRILDLARLMITMSGQIPEVDIPIQITGLRPGEKLDEELLDDGETVVQRIDRKIRVVAGPVGEEDLRRAVEELMVLAATEDDTAIRAELERLVPGYRPLRAGAVPLVAVSSAG
ncbi:MAG: nucleoside-diphosphate sugar epimerase/dehydratase [Acidobacteriota bacterium]